MLAASATAYTPVWLAGAAHMVGLRVGFALYPTTLTRAAETLQRPRVCGGRSTG